MNAIRLEYVVDASVGIKLFVDESGSAIAATLFDQLVATPPARLYVPDLFYVETANILWKYVRRFAFPVAAAKEAVRTLSALDLASVSTSHLIGDALPIAVEHGVTVYDGCYVALAAALGVPLVTADERLAHALRDTHHRIIPLRSVNLS